MCGHFKYCQYPELPYGCGSTGITATCWLHERRPPSVVLSTYYSVGLHQDPKLCDWQITRAWSVQCLWLQENPWFNLQPLLVVWPTGRHVTTTLLDITHTYGICPVINLIRCPCYRQPQTFDINDHKNSSLGLVIRSQNELGIAVLCFGHNIWRH